MDSTYSALAGSFGAISTEFLAQKVEKIDPPLPLTVRESESAHQAIQLMKQNRIGSILIVNDDDKLTGIFSERDVLTKVILTDINLKDTPISALMTPNPRTETYDTTVAFVLRLMVDGRFRHVPIVDEENYPIGIVSIKDILEFIESEMVKQLVAKELGKTL